MKLIYTILFIITISFVSFAQSFQFDPTDNYHGISPLNQYKNHYVFMENLTGGSLDLAWTRLSLDFPEEWEVILCDYGGCYVGIPENGQMLTIEDTTRGYLRITLNPLDRLGSGSVSFYVYDIKQPDSGDTVSFTLTSEALTKMDENLVSQKVNVYPNPASDFIYVDLSEIDASSIALLNSRGKSVLQKEISSQDQFKLELSDLPIGLFLLNIKTSNGDLIRKKIIVQ